MSDIGKYPQIKFFKKHAADILAGNKTMEARPRSPKWIAAIENTPFVELTYGARYRPATIITLARIKRVEIKPFAEATEEDVRRFGCGWQHRSIEEFVRVHEQWYAKELSKGYPVAWIYFKLVEGYSNPKKSIQTDPLEPGSK